MHWASLHGLHCIQSGSIAPQCMEYSAFNHAAWNSLHSIGFHFFFTLPGIHCIQSHCMESTAFNWDDFYHAEWNTQHSITLHGIHCIQAGCFWPCCIKSNAFNYSAGIHCLQSCCIKSPAFNRVPFLHSAWNTLHSIMLHGIHGIQSGCILPGCI